MAVVIRTFSTLRAQINTLFNSDFNARITLCKDASQKSVKTSDSQAEKCPDPRAVKT
ncbi:hypothetical protein [Adlercreutzia murintestinalis]|uniref:hypothetical protein n=1 Tax=Adlercreutzia murintestinalis TaxID=2941325 RepID=UPI00204241CE|nr:hypothetical protein [Adlercreutzia murintestinalis]